MRNYKESLKAGSGLKIDQTKIGHISHEISNNQWAKLSNLIFVHFCFAFEENVIIPVKLGEIIWMQNKYFNNNHFVFIM